MRKNKLYNKCKGNSTASVSFTFSSSLFCLLKSFYYCVKCTEIVTIMVKTGIIFILSKTDFSFLQNKLPHEKKENGKIKGKVYPE